jgi:hypothetical protein
MPSGAETCDTGSVRKFPLEIGQQKERGPTYGVPPPVPLPALHVRLDDLSAVGLKRIPCPLKFHGIGRFPRGRGFGLVIVMTDQSLDVERRGTETISG